MNEKEIYEVLEILQIKGFILTTYIVENSERRHQCKFRYCYYIKKNKSTRFHQTISEVFSSTEIYNGDPVIYQLDDYMSEDIQQILVSIYLDTRTEKDDLFVKSLLCISALKQWPELFSSLNDKTNDSQLCTERKMKI